VASANFTVEKHQGVASTPLGQWRINSQNCDISFSFVFILLTSFVSVCMSILLPRSTVTLLLYVSIELKELLT